MKRSSYKDWKTTVLANYIERFNIPTVLIAMLVVRVSFVESCYMKLVFDVISNLTCLYRSCLNTNILKSFRIFGIIWILNLFYHTISSPKTHFFISRILGFVTGDVMNIVPLFSWQYSQKVSPYIQIQIFTWAIQSCFRVVQSQCPWDDTSGCTVMLKGGTISMPTGRHLRLYSGAEGWYNLNAHG